MPAKKIPVTPKFVERQQNVLNLLPQEYDGLWITNMSNIRYLTNFSGSSGGLLLSRNEIIFFTDFRYQEQSSQEVRKNALISIYKISSAEAFVEYLKAKKLKKIAIEGCLTIEILEILKKNSEGKVEFQMVKNLPEKIRRNKDKPEMEFLQKAFNIADKAFQKLLKFIRSGRKELEIAAKLEFFLSSLGSEKTSFDTIVASGERASCPHAKPTEKKVAAGEMLKIDFGAVYKGYHSDMTRTVFLGTPDEKFNKIYNTVLEAQRLAVKTLKPGVSCFDVDKVAREHIKSAGFGDYFGHGLGHSLGLDIHESPNLSTKCNEIVESGNVFTVEPGIYIPGWGGVRIEDVYVVETSDLKRLTNTTNELIVIK
ncbi:MAG: aminopeptidase P family protein [Candidatus Riflebacteria bacterium]|nr:aminopeptidase P family protein [Candidatus Riflebacteria bacterium]